MVYLWSFLHGGRDKVGHDYSYYLPHVLAGYYWQIENGYFSLASFSPAFCGGLPFLYSPQNSYLSVHQYLAIVVDPLQSFFVSALLFGLLGGIGTGMLARRRFAMSMPAACLSAVIFLLNGFFMYRMAIGHALFYCMALTPLLALAVMRPEPACATDASGRWVAVLVRASIFAIGLAVAFYTGAVIILLPMLLAIFILRYLHALRRAPSPDFWTILTVGGALTLALCAFKLAPAMIFVGQFPRPAPFVLESNLWQLLATLLTALFLPQILPAVAEPTPLLHELQFGVGIVPLLLLVVSAPTALRGGGARWSSLLARIRNSAAPLTALLLLLLLPIAATHENAFSTQILTRVPIIENMHILGRFWMAYIPFLAILAGLCLDALCRGTGMRHLVAGVAILLTAAQLLASDRRFFDDQPYDPSSVREAWREVRASGAPPAVTRLVELGGMQRTGGNQTRFVFVPRDDGLVEGISTIDCYEPIFGYRLEIFPGGLRPGPPLQSDDGRLNIRNPACFIYGDANGCRPGDTFTVEQRAEAAKFIAYRPFAFREPWWQHALGWLALATFAGCLTVLSWAGWRRLSRR